MLPSEMDFPEARETLAMRPSKDSLSFPLAKDAFPKSVSRGKNYFG